MQDAPAHAFRVLKLITKYSVYRPLGSRVIASIYLIPNEDGLTIVGTIVHVSGGITRESFSCTFERDSIIAKLLDGMGFPAEDVGTLVKYIQIEGCPVPYVPF